MSIPPEILFGVGILILLAVLVWAAIYNHRRNRRNDRISETATHELYAHPESYPEERKEFEKEVCKT
jgi:hypothetical protein